MADAAEFRDFAAAQAPRLRRSAYLMCGDWTLAEDLMQTALVKIYLSWSRIAEPATLDSYARKVLVRTWLDESRRPWRRRERGTDRVPDVGDDRQDPALRAERAWDREVVRRGLDELPRKQRAAVVLRYFDELTVAEAARVLGCSAGTVKSQTARGLATLSELIAPSGRTVRDRTDRQKVCR